MTHWAPIGAVAVLIACGACGTGGADGLAVPPVPASPGSLEQVEWQLVEVERDGQVEDVSGVDAVLRLDGDGSVSGRACNSFGGRAVVDPQRLQLADGMSTSMLCTGPPAEVEDLVTSALRDGVAWEVTDGLVLRTGDGTVLRWRDRGSAWSDPAATTLLQGQQGDASYRLSWSAEQTGAAVVLEVVPGPGRPAGSSATLVSRDDPPGGVEPTALALEGGAVLWVAAPAGSAAVVAVQPGGERPLTPYALDGLPQLRVWAAVLPEPSLGTHVEVRDAAGGVVATSRTLPY